MSKNILIIGASSAIAEAVAREFVAREKNLRFVLMARNATKLHGVETDLKVRGAVIVSTKAFDFNDYTKHRQALVEAYKELGSFDVVLLAHGSLTEQVKSNQSEAYTVEELNTNLVSFASFLVIIPELMSRQRSGTIAVISSVAGDRGRSSLYTYGIAKAGLSTLCQGLRQRLFKQGINVLCIKPGPVDTPMVAGLPKGLPVASTATVARDIYNAIKSGKAEIYTPWFWRYIMMILKAVPEWIFKRVSL